VATTLERAQLEVTQLAREFRQHVQTYLSPDYTEARARQDYIDKFFTALGWDVAHNFQKNPFEQEVKVERNVQVGASQRRADYAFFIAPNFRDVRFFAEAKKPLPAIKTTNNYFQTIRYAWNSQTPIAVLTDFHQTHILDCRYIPDVDTATDRGALEYTYTEYANPEKFAELYYLISREAVENGSLEKFAATLPRSSGKAIQRGLFPGGYQGIDDAFLKELDDYRDSLARGLKNRNPELDGEILTELVQRILDRLVFLRFLEDKQIETRQSVSKFGDSGSVWNDFLAASRHLDATYNGIVFKPHALLDSKKLQIDEDVFGGICEQLANVNSPYDFNSIPIHILGSIYERFLGKIIVTTDKRARVEEKPEVRKAGGVYYTPEYVVRYIVAQTVGPLVEGKTPAELSGLRIADIACGSGSFLLGVYDYLLHYHRTWYNANPGKARTKDCVKHEDGTLHLSLSKKREILLNNIYGVDIDPQAVEVAHLSMYLKLLEEETPASARNHQLEFQETLLPSLSKNIVSGNSLIGTDILGADLFASTDTKDLNPMNFADRFSDTMKRGGFDAIVGNPPYVRPHKLPAHVKEYLWKTLKTFVAKSDLYSCFMERSIDLLGPGGRIGYIVPHTWTSLESFEEIRKKLVHETKVNLLTQLPKRVFRDATVETCIFVAERSARSKSPRNPIRIERLEANGATTLVREFPQGEIPKEHLHNFQLYAQADTGSMARKIRKITRPLEEYVEFVYGFKTADDEKFIHSERRHRESKPFIRSAAIHRYYHEAPTEFVWYVPERMTANRRTARPGEARRFESAKILVSRMGKDLIASYDDGGLYVKDAMLLLPKSNLPLKYVLGLLNSKLLRFLYREYFITIDVLKNALLALPIRPIDEKVVSDVAACDRIVAIVDRLLGASGQRAGVVSDRERERFQNVCAGLERELDSLVFELYGLSAEDIELVDNAIQDA
jgi:adenine-specific DNA-methyltransferase